MKQTEPNLNAAASIFTKAIMSSGFSTVFSYGKGKRIIFHTSPYAIACLVGGKWKRKLRNWMGSLKPALSPANMGRKTLLSRPVGNT
ncbi:hypothetical protein [Phaeobacter sp. CECT 5382]|uniref:hypothetical protein n=1 Tax=Phaeobacter sp. CECT 5382 TaxID=1712645 RepID=UPI0012E33DF7|nr:hypothetical protein [Phaeobacter sp. CECT 5382]